MKSPESEKSTLQVLNKAFSKIMTTWATVISLLFCLVVGIASGSFWWALAAFLGVITVGSLVVGGGMRVVGAIMLAKEKGLL